MSDDQNDDQKIEVYIQQNRFTYTREAITDNLLVQGHRREDIDRIWRKVELADIPHPGTRPRNSASKTSRGIGSLIWLWIATLACPLFFLLSTNSAMSEYGPNYYLTYDVPSPSIINILFVGAEIGTLIIAVYLWRKGKRFWHIGALLLTINFILSVIAFGTCLSITGI